MLGSQKWMAIQLHRCGSERASRLILNLYKVYPCLVVPQEYIESFDFDGAKVRFFNKMSKCYFYKKASVQENTRKYNPYTNSCTNMDLKNVVIVLLRHENDVE